MALRSRLPIIGSAIFLLLGAGAYFLPNFVPYMAINGINIVEHKDIIAIALGAIAAVFLLISFVAGRSKSEDDETSDETEVYEEAVVVEITEDAPAAVSTEAFYQDGYDVPVFDNTVEEFDAEAPVKLTSAEKRALKAAAKAEKKRLKEEAKFAKKAEKEAAKAAKIAAKAAAKGAVAEESEILDAETGTDWYKDDEFLTQTVTETPVAEDAAESSEEVAEETVEVTEVTEENWTEAAYTDPNFAVPFAEETVETPAEAEAETEVETEEAPAVEAEAAVESADVVALKAQVAALEAAINEQAQNTQYALLELSEATRSNSTARLEWLKDMVEKNNFGDDVVLRMIDMLIRQSKADEGTVQSALSANDLRK